MEQQDLRMERRVASGFDLLLLNCGTVINCVRYLGESVIDLSWASPPAARSVNEWQMMDEVETLSENRYTTVEILPR